MTAPACQRTREAVAVDALTSSSGDGGSWDDEVSAHLRGCTECRAELEQLAPLAGALAMLKADHGAFAVLGANGSPGPVGALVPGPAPAPPDELLDRVLAAASGERSRRRRRRLLAPLAAAAAVAAMAVPVALWASDDPEPPVPASAAPQPVAPIVLAGYDQDSHVRARVELRATGAGSDVAAEISGVRNGTECTVRVVGADGVREVVASWVASYSPASEGVGSISGSVPMPPAELAGVEIVDSDADRILLKIKM